MQRQILALTLFVIAILVLAACAAPVAAPAPAPAPTTAAQPTAAPQAAAGEPYKIGFVTSITGPASSLGIPERDTALMIQDQVNKAGGIKGPDGNMHPIELIVEDDASDASKATLAAKKLVEQDNVAVLIGSSGSPASLAMIETATKNSTPMISMASASQIVNPIAERKWIFKTPQANQPVTAVQLDWLKANGITKVASIGVNNAFGKDSRDAMNEQFKAAGIEVLADEVFQPGDKDFTAQLTKIKGLNPQAVIVHATPGEGAPLTVQYHTLGMTAPLLHNHGIGNKDFINLAQDSAEGVMFPIGKLLVANSLPDSDPQKAVLLKYIADYGAFTNGKAPSSFGGHGWDAVEIALAGLESVGPDRAKLRDYFENNVRNFVGISGIFNWSPTDHVGIGKESLVLVKIKDGTWAFVAPDQYKMTQ
ncbi:MAG: ABC transporter substrate-binding protein [Anaerolineae bacterium]|nr:ABC transporter substrate-binding protein [Anaerolineae bacterium]